MSSASGLESRVASAVLDWHSEVKLRSLTALPGGMSSITLLAEIDGGHDLQSIVIKVAPPGLEPSKNRDVLRQARILKVLAAESDVPVPAVIFESKALPPLFAMTRVDGDSHEPIIDDPHALPAPLAAARMTKAAKVLAALHSADPVALLQCGEQPRDLSQELEYWQRVHRAADRHSTAAHDNVFRGLATTVPSPAPFSILHGDYRLGNMLSSGGDVRAVIDWELWSVGDPRMDLAWFLLFADSAAQPGIAHDYRGLPSPESIVTAYALSCSRFAPTELRLMDLPWFAAFVRYKQAGALRLLARNAAMAQQPIKRYLLTTPTLLLDRAQALLAG